MTTTSIAAGNNRTITTQREDLKNITKKYIELGLENDRLRTELIAAREARFRDVRSEGVEYAKTVITELRTRIKRHEETIAALQGRLAGLNQSIMTSSGMSRLTVELIKAMHGKADAESLIPLITERMTELILLEQALIQILKGENK